MITVIIAGGSGTRLWPLSTQNYPKHLLALTNEKSMLQNTYERALGIGPDVYVVTDASHADHVKQQLSDLDDAHFIVEPGRRGTASCIVAALDHIARKHDRNEPVVFLSADHHVRDAQGFAHSFQLAGQASAKEKKIALVGVEPDYPAIGFGYIEKAEPIDEESSVYGVVCFKEKPEFEVAREYVESGRYLWNCGYFVGSVDTFVTEMEQRAPALKKNFDTLQKIENTYSREYGEAYLNFENDTIDYALIEKVDDLLVVPASFDWMDVGSFKDLHAANVSDQEGNYTHGSNIELAEVQNAFIRNEEDTPIAVIGLDNIVVINTKDGILVARKDMSKEVGDIAKKIQSK